MASSQGIKGGGVSAPPFPCLYSGPVLVCGSAWTLDDDWEKARGLFPRASVIAVNAAAEHVKAGFLFSQHPLKFPRWISYQRRFHHGFTVHAAGRRHLKTKFGETVPMPWVDYWWVGVASNGSSAWGARRLAAVLGFEQVILCGVPLEPGEYIDGTLGKMNRRHKIMSGYRQEILRDTEMHSGVSSMSGWTKAVFGEP